VAARHIGHEETRHRGTVGGSLAHADPVGELPVVAAGLGGEIVVRGRGGERTIPATDFVTGPRRTALNPDELVVAVRLPVAGDGTGYGFAELARRVGDAALATAVARVELGGDGTITAATLTLGAVAGRPTAVDVSALTEGEEIAAVAAAAEGVVEDDPETGDVGPTAHPPRVPPPYRRRLARAVAARALTAAVENARGGQA
jgi:carbon-monoxide dehydrogenase medium subunit